MQDYVYPPGGQQLTARTEENYGTLEAPTCAWHLEKCVICILSIGTDTDGQVPGTDVMVVAMISMPILRRGYYYSLLSK